MKNLLIYINPRHDFDEEGKIAVKIQIDNSLDLGWKRQDIMLVTNFNYEYNGVKSLVAGDDNYYTFEPTVSKINVIVDLFEQKLIEKGEIYWFHDLDAYQLSNITESELGLDSIDMFLPDYGRMPRWATGSIFFRNSSIDIFNWIKNIAYKYKVDEEYALGILTGNDLPDDFPLNWIKGYTSDNIPGIKNINERIKKANITYNFHCFNVDSNYAAALKPIRVVHFHFIERLLNPTNPRTNQVDFFMHGKNKIGMQFVPDRLVKIFNKHGIK